MKRRKKEKEKGNNRYEHKIFGTNGKLQAVKQSTHAHTQNILIILKTF